MYDDTLLIDGLNELNIQYNDTMLDQLHTYYDMMVETNKVMNLTAITEYQDVCTKHWLDSLCIVKANQYIDLSNDIKILDIGTGAGFPGVPIKIFFPNIEITLLDSLNKRIRFLEEVVRECNLTNVTCVHGRAEELSRKDEYREQYDLCVSRAVTRMASLAELSLPFVKRNGFFIPYKSGEAETEVNEAKKAIDTLGGKLITTETFTVPQSDLGRSLIIVQKVLNTPSKYPRGGGKPMNSPIL